MTKKLSYNEAIEEIEAIIQKIEDNEYSIDELTEKVKRVSFLLSFCKDKLHATEDEVEKILNQSNNK
jgi:exodeoxyribonuclease VII small subunit